MIRAEAKVLNPDKVEVQITFSATIEELKTLASNQPTVWPCAQFRSVIHQVVGQTVERVERAHGAES